MIGFADYKEGLAWKGSFPRLGEELFRDGEWCLIRDYLTLNGKKTATIAHDCPEDGSTIEDLTHSQSANAIVGKCGRCGAKVPTEMIGFWRLETWER